MSAIEVWRDGLRRVRRAPALVVFLWVLTLLVTMPPAIALENSIETHLGSSLESDSAADGVNFGWMQEFRTASGPLGRTLRPEVIGFGATVDNMSALADASVRSAVVPLAAATYIVLVWFGSAGAISRLAAQRRIEARGFAAACGAFAGRLFRLGLIATIAYGVLFATVHQALLDDGFSSITADMTVERNAFMARLVLYLIFLLMLGGINLLLDVARVRLIVENRYSVAGALVAAARFVRMRPRIAVGAYLLNVLAYLVVVAGYAALAPGAGSAGWQLWVAFALGQAYVVARLTVKLAFWGAEIAGVETACARVV